MSVGLAVTHQPFTVCCPLLIMAMFAHYIRWAICYKLGLNTSHVLNKRFLLNNMTTGHLGQGQNQRRCPKRKVRFHRLTQLLPCCFSPPALPSSATPGKAPPAKSLQGSWEPKPGRRWLTAWWYRFIWTMMAKWDRIPTRHISLWINTITPIHWTSCLISWICIAVKKESAQYPYECRYCQSK